MTKGAWEVCPIMVGMGTLNIFMADWLINPKLENILPISLMGAEPPFIFLDLDNCFVRVFFLLGFRFRRLVIRIK